MKKNTLIVFLLLLQSCLVAEDIQTFYGPISVEEPIILELIESPAIQRLKKVYQYGDSHYTTHPEHYTRYDHSLGVFAILRIKKLPLNEQIAGLLHDVSHTVFSHVGDFIFEEEFENTDHQDSIHEWFLKRYGIEEILNKYGLTSSMILHKSGEFPALEQELPNLCADRIDYNIQGAYHQGYLTYNECLTLIKDLKFVDGVWISSTPQLLKKAAEFSLDMTKNCWGSAKSFLTSKWLSAALHKGLQNQEIHFEDIYFGTDDRVWKTLHRSNDPLIQKLLFKILNADYFFTLAGPQDADINVQRKFRGIDPWIKEKGVILRLTEIDLDFAENYQSTKNFMESGWNIKMKKPAMEQTPEYLYKIISPENWNQSKETLQLDAADNAFIHLSREDQLDRILSKYWTDTPAIVLKLETKKLQGRLVLETNPGGTSKYYHLYEGSIPKNAVVEVKELLSSKV